MRETLGYMRDSWDVIHAKELYVFVSSLEYVDGVMHHFSKEEIREKEEQERIARRKKAQERFDSWIPSLEYHQTIVGTYVKKIAEWQSGQEKPKIARPPAKVAWIPVGHQTDVEISQTSMLVRNTMSASSIVDCKPKGKRKGKVQERERGFKVLAAFTNGTVAMELEELRKKLKIPKTDGSNYISKCLTAARKIFRDVGSSFTLSEPRAGRPVQLVQKMD